MMQTLEKQKLIQCGYLVPGVIVEEDEVELEEGFVELEEGEDEINEDIEWVWEEELETQIDGPKGPIIIKKGRYTEIN